MAGKKRGGLGRGIGALIPQPPADKSRPVDVFFPAPASDASGVAGSAVNSSVNTGDKTKKTSKIASDALKSAPTSIHLGSAAKIAQPAAQEADFSGGGEKNIEADTAELLAVPGVVLAEIELAQIIPNRVNPRKDFAQDALAELSHSIKEFGVFQPIVVRELPADAATGTARYELVMGERRYRASQLAGRTSIPAIIRSTADENMLRDALLENLHRADLNPLEEASAYQQLMSDFGITQEQLAERIGRSRPQISNTIRLLKLPETVQQRVAAGVLSAGHARAILSLDDAAAMEALANKIINHDLTVREAEAEVKKQPRRVLPKLRKGGLSVQLDEIAERLGDRFDTRVTIKLNAKKGQLVFDFASVADLNRILDTLGDPGFQ